MPIISLQTDNPFVDRRQSQRAMTVRKGVERHYAETGWATLPELTLPNGRRADVVALSPRGEVLIVEIKSSVEDLKADHKWSQYQDYCDELVFATLGDVPEDIFPKEAGFMVADSHGAELLRPAPRLALNAARRKKIHLLFARSSAQRLARCCAYAGMDSVQFD